MTKLTKIDKQTRKMLKTDFPNVQLFAFPDIGVTVGIERTGETKGRFSVAVMAEDEPRFKRKVGELIVLQRFYYGETLPMNLTSDMEDFTFEAEHIAVAVA